MTTDVKAASVKVGVTDRTLYRWLDEPVFREALKAAENEAISLAVRQLAGTAGAAVSVIRMIMADKTLPASVRLRAATTVLDNLIKLRNFAEFEERLSAIEATLATKGNEGPYQGHSNRHPMS